MNCGNGNGYGATSAATIEGTLIPVCCGRGDYGLSGRSASCGHRSPHHRPACLILQSASRSKWSTGKPQSAAAQLGQHDLHLALPNAELAQGEKTLAWASTSPSEIGLPLGGAIGMPEGDGPLPPALDEQLTAVGRSVMRRAQRQEIRGLVAAAFGARLDMVHVDEGRVMAARDAAAALIARKHGASQRGRDALLGARARTGVGGIGSVGSIGSVGLLRWRCVRGGLVLAAARRAHVDLVRILTGRTSVDAGVLIGSPDLSNARHEGQALAQVLHIARGHVDDRRIDGHELACRGLCAAAASRADAERDLVAAAPLVRRAAEDVASHREQGGVVVQSASGQASQL